MAEMSGTEAQTQACMTAEVYMLAAVAALCKRLDIGTEQLAPFAPVLAAMIMAAAQDLNTAVVGGLVENTVAAAAKVEAGA